MHIPATPACYAPRLSGTRGMSSCTGEGEPLHGTQSLSYLSLCCLYRPSERGNDRDLVLAGAAVLGDTTTRAIWLSAPPQPDRSDGGGVRSGVAGHAAARRPSLLADPPRHSHRSGGSRRGCPLVLPQCHTVTCGVDRHHRSCGGHRAAG